nr:hypothetical protein [Prolixibacter denitrificans]
MDQYQIAEHNHQSEGDGGVHATGDGRQQGKPSQRDFEPATSHESGEEEARCEAAHDEHLRQVRFNPVVEAFDLGANDFAPQPGVLLGKPSEEINEYIAGDNSRENGSIDQHERYVMLDTREPRRQYGSILVDEGQEEYREKMLQPCEVKKRHRHICIVKVNPFSWLVAAKSATSTGTKILNLFYYLTGKS